MLKRVAITLLFLSAVASPGAPASDSPALQVFRQWLEAFNSGDAAKTSAFWRKYGRAGEDRSADDLHLREMTGGMTISKVEEDTGTHLVVLMKEGRGTYSESTLELETANPPVVARIGGHPVPGPQIAGPPASSDEDLAKRVQEHVAETGGADAFSGAVLIAHNGKVVLDLIPAGMLHTDSRPEIDRVEGRAIGYASGPNGLARTQPPCPGAEPQPVEGIPLSMTCCGSQMRSKKVSC